MVCGGAAFGPLELLPVVGSLVILLTKREHFRPSSFDFTSPARLDSAHKYANDVKDLIDHATPGKIACFIAECIQGVGGTVVLPDGYLKEVHEDECCVMLAVMRVRFRVEPHRHPQHTHRTPAQQHTITPRSTPTAHRTAHPQYTQHAHRHPQHTHRTPPHQHAHTRRSTPHSTPTVHPRRTHNTPIAHTAHPQPIQHAHSTPTTHP